MAALEEGEKDVAALNVSDERARYPLTQLAASGKIELIGKCKA